MYKSFCDWSNCNDRPIRFMFMFLIIKSNNSNKTRQEITMYKLRKKSNFFNTLNQKN